MIRRFSGGGTVIVDEETIFVTMICNRDSVNIPPFPNSILCWNGSIYGYPLRDIAFQIKENDFAIETKKFGGNAQYICKDRWLHHSTLLWNYHPEKMKYLKIPPKMPAYRQGRDHENFLCALSSYLANKNAFIQDLLESLSRHFIVEEVVLGEVMEYLERPHRKATEKLLKGV